MKYFDTNNIEHIYPPDYYIAFPVLATINLSNKKVAPFINAGVVGYIFNAHFLTFNTNLGIGAYFFNKLMCSFNFENESFLNNYWLNFKVGYNIK